MLGFAGVAHAQAPTVGKLHGSSRGQHLEHAHRPACRFRPTPRLTSTRSARRRAFMPISAQDSGTADLIGIPFITVPGTQTKYPASFTYADESDPGPYAVPLNAPIEGAARAPATATRSPSTSTTAFSTSCTRPIPQAASWQAGSGAIFNLLSNNLRVATWTSADAAGLPIFPGLVRYDEIVAGEIRHALRFTVPQTQKAYVWPARHYASSLTGAQYPPMGVRFRLRADFDISSFSPTNQIILKALKKYGMMIADNGSSWFVSGAPDSRWNNDELHDLGRVHGSDFEVVDVSGLMISPDSGQAQQSTVTPPPPPPVPLRSALPFRPPRRRYASTRPSCSQRRFRTHE